MRWRSPAAKLLALVTASAAASACSLLTSTDGLAGGAASIVDGAGPETGTPVDAATEAESSAGDAGDAGPERSKAYAAAVVLDHPLGYWRLEETSGTVAKDEMGKFDGVYVLSPSLGQQGAAGSRGIKLGKDTNARIKVDVPDFRFPGKLPFSVERA